MQVYELAGGSAPYEGAAYGDVLLVTSRIRVADTVASTLQVCEMLSVLRAFIALD
jgi:hypothetical protein